MSAIEYGSYYWCVVLQGKDANTPGETIHLHADEMTIEPGGGLTFKSVGRRPAGADPKKTNEKQDGKDTADSGKEDQKNEDPKNKESGDKAKQASMIYLAFAPSTWKLVFAAKLQDGSPASIEHWTSDANDSVATHVPANSGAAGYAPPPG